MKVLCCPCSSGWGLALPEGKPASWLVVAPSFHFCSCHGLATASSRGLSLPSRQDGPSVSHMLPDSEMEWVPCLLLMASSAPARPGLCWPLVTGLHRGDHVPNHVSHQEGCKVGLLLSPCSETMSWGLSLPLCSPTPSGGPSLPPPLPHLHPAPLLVARASTYRSLHVPASGHVCGPSGPSGTLPQGGLVASVSPGCT